MHVGVLTGGGDCPGLNAVIRAIVRKGIDVHGAELVGFRDGWKGPLEHLHSELTIESTRGILPRGGTILGTSRTNPIKADDGPRRILETMSELGLDALIAIGGEDTLGAAVTLNAEHGLNVVGVPKTIDNDLGATDVTFGFDTALQVATEAIDRLHTTAESHHRVMVVEVMGRHAGWIALYSGLAGGADVILIPERPFDIEEVCGLIERRHGRGRPFSIVVVAEGALPVEGTMETAAAGEDEFGHVRLGGIGQRLESEIEQRTGFETRAVVLGHIQRGGTPTAYDRVLATRLGVAAIDAVHDERWGMMPALRGTRVELVPLADAVAELRTVPPEDYAVALPFLGSAALIAALALSSCGSSGITGASRATVYVSMPLRGTTGRDGWDIVDGARMALADAGGRVGRLAVRARYLDDTAGSGPSAAWSPAAVGANARKATEDTSAVAYIGDFEAGATRTSEPITNAAHLLQVSPASTSIDLTRPFLGSDQLPAVEDQGGERTFGRVIPSDPAQAAAAAAWVRRLGERRVELVSDGSSFGRVMASSFRESLRGAAVTRRGAQLLYYAGLAGSPAEKKALAPGRPVMASDALVPPFDPAGPGPADLVTSAAQDTQQLPPSGHRFAAAFRSRFGRAPERYAAYGYEAMAVVLASIRRAGSAGDQRQAVVDAFFATRGRRSVLGTYSIDPLGDTTLDRMSGYRSTPSGLRPVALLRGR